MGYDTFNAFGCDYDSISVLAQVAAMMKFGLVEAGYNSLILDDCCTLKNRSASGNLVEDPTKFPNGMKAFFKQMKSYGVSASAYSDNGYQTCASYPGAYGHELQDLKVWDEWGFDYLKYDNCYIPFDSITQENMFGRYQRMSSAIAEYARTSNKTFEYPLCWRINGDIKPYWGAIAAIIDTASFIWWGSDFYGHNDMDILEVCNTGQGTPPGNLTYDEVKSHFTAWALLKSHLIVGTDLSNATAEPIEILSNKDLIKINQDPEVGAAFSPFRWGVNPDYMSNASTPAEYWTGNSSYGVVSMILNNQGLEQQLFFNLTESWAIRAGRQYSVYYMWSHTQNGTAVRNMTMTLPAHGVAALLLNDDGPEQADAGPPYCGFFYQCSYPNGTYASN